METIVKSFTIQKKFAFSPYLSNDRIRDKLLELRCRQVPERDVLLNMPDEEVVFYWLKNWIHPDLAHWVYKSPQDKRGCSAEVLQRDLKRDALHEFENSQHYYDYTLADIEEYIDGE